MSILSSSQPPAANAVPLAHVAPTRIALDAIGIFGLHSSRIRPTAAIGAAIAVDKITSRAMSARMRLCYLIN